MDLTVSSIAQVYAFMGKPAPPHPHIAVVAASWQPPLRLVVPVMDRAIHSGLYAVSLKRGDECRVSFGRQSNDAQAGTIVFLAPGQTMLPLGSSGDAKGEHGWTLIFHPDLLGAWAAQVGEYGFFRYSQEESLHLDDREQETLTALVRQIEREVEGAPDAFANEVLTAHLRLLFGYCQRYYGRQFKTRAGSGDDVVTRVRRFLADFLDGKPRGLPTVAACARALGYSPDYLSDLLREATGSNARDHIHHALMEAAKQRLTESADSVSEIAYALGFEQPQHFAKLFKQKVGCSPSDFRGLSRETASLSPKPRRR